MASSAPSFCWMSSEASGQHVGWRHSAKGMENSKVDTGKLKMFREAGGGGYWAGKTLSLGTDEPKEAAVRGKRN